MVDRFAARQKEKFALVQGIKADIKEVLVEKGYGDFSKYAHFSITCKPDRFKGVAIMYNTLFFLDNEGNEWHSDNVNELEELLGILRAMYHILPR
jgi:hypothetical protein